jgi:hypothetical protein
VGSMTPINRVVRWGPRGMLGQLAWLGHAPIQGLVRSTLWAMLIHSLGCAYALYITPIMSIGVVS